VFDELPRLRRIGLIDVTASRVVIGGSIAAIALVERLSARGVAVEWWRPQHVGGGFSAVVRGEHRLPLGCRLIELSYGPDDSEPSLDDFRPGPAGHAPYQRRVRHYVSELLGDELVEVPAPQRVIDGRRAPDPYFTSDLSVLPSLLRCDDLTVVARQVDDVVSRVGPMGLHGNLDELRSTPLPAASIAQHGSRLHSLLIEPIVNKVLGDNGDDIPADLHNKVWAPLYWPKTVAEAASGVPVQYRPERQFHTDAHGGMGELIVAMLGRIHSCSAVTQHVLASGWSVSAVDGDVALCSDGNHVRRHRDRVALATSVAELSSAVDVAYSAPRVDVRLMWWTVPRDARIGIDHVLIDGDANSPIHRVVAPAGSATGETAGPRSARDIIAVECAADAPGDVDSVMARLIALGALSDGCDAEFIDAMTVPAFTRPTFAARSGFARWHDEVRNRLGEMCLVGPLSAFGADVLNEQLFQALRLNEVWT
jgi:hypothetical protein